MPRSQVARRIIGLAIFLGFGSYGVVTAQRWIHWPSAPRDMTIAEAVNHPEAPWVRLTDGAWRCDYAYTEESFSYFTLTDGRIVVLAGYDDKPQCPPPPMPAGAFREASSMLLDTVQHLGFNRDAIAPPAGAAPLPVYALFTHEGPGNFIVTVPVFFILAGIGLAYGLIAGKRSAPTEGDEQERDDPKKELSDAVEDHRARAAKLDA